MPPLFERLIKGNEKGGDRERTHGQGPLIHSRSVIMWSGLKETEIEIQRDRKPYKRDETEKRQQMAAREQCKVSWTTSAFRCPCDVGQTVELDSFNRG